MSARTTRGGELDAYLRRDAYLYIVPRRLVLIHDRKLAYTTWHHYITWNTYLWNRIKWNINFSDYSLHEYLTWHIPNWTRGVIKPVDKSPKRGAAHRPSHRLIRVTASEFTNWSSKLHSDTFSVYRDAALIARCTHVF